MVRIKQTSRKSVGGTAPSLRCVYAIRPKKAGAAKGRRTRKISKTPKVPKVDDSSSDDGSFDVDGPDDRLVPSSLQQACNGCGHVEPCNDLQLDLDPETVHALSQMQQVSDRDNWPGEWELQPTVLTANMNDHQIKSRETVMQILAASNSRIDKASMAVMDARLNVLLWCLSVRAWQHCLFKATTAWSSMCWPAGIKGLAKGWPTKLCIHKEVGRQDVYVPVTTKTIRKLVGCVAGTLMERVRALLY